MNRQTLRTLIREEIEDQGSFYSDIDLNAAIQECYTEYVKDTKVIEKKVTINFQDDLVYYNLRTLVPDFLRVKQIYDTNSRSWLTGRSIVWLDKRYTEWETKLGIPQNFSIISPELIAFFPHLEIATSASFELYYDALAPIIATDSEVLNIFTNSNDLFIFYSTFYLMLQAKEFTKAKLSLQEFDKRLKQAVISANSRALPDRKYGLKG